MQIRQTACPVRHALVIAVAVVAVAVVGVVPASPAYADEPAATAPAATADDPASTGAQPGVILEPEAYPGHVFVSRMPLSRAQVAGLLAMALGLPAASADPFVDDEGLPLETSINRVAAAGISVGCQPGSYCPWHPVTRGQFALLLERAVPQPAVSEDYFSDDQGTYFESAVNRLAAAGVIHGCGPDSFCPYGAVTRAEASTMLSRLLGSAFASTDPVERWRPMLSVWFAPADVERALDVIHCESRGDPSAVNPTSGATGLFQHIPRYWADRSANAGLPGASIFDPDANAAVAAWLVYQDGGWRHWYPSAYCWG